MGLSEIMDNKYCKYCWPTKRKNHFIIHLSYYINKYIAVILKPFGYLRKKIGGNRQDYFWGLFLEFLSFLKIVKFIDQPDKTKLYNRSLIFFEEAKRQNLQIKAIKFLGKYVNEFKLIYNKKGYYYEGIPLTIFKEPVFNMDDKYNIKKILQKNNIPTAAGQIFTNVTKALNYGKNIGFPLVVKPYNGSLSHHVTCPINSTKQLLNAIKIAKQYTPVFIIEKFINGGLFRASVVGKKHVFVCQKDRANIIGNGYSTIEELIKLKNKNFNRGTINQMNSTLHIIPINDVLTYNLKNQGFNSKTILSKNKKIYLQNKFVLSHGCDIINCTGNVHTQNKELFLRVANILHADLVGIDFICFDISKSYKKQETAILECNSLPYIDMHQYPSHGKPEPVAGIVWKIILDKLTMS